MTHKPLISVILSVYNVQEYLVKCLESITKQSFDNIEIICIDDCSTDATITILKEYSCIDSRIIILQQSMNMGLGDSRNKGISIAKGEYIIFIDGDDFFDLTMLEKAYKLAESQQSDIVLWDYDFFYDFKINKSRKSRLNKKMSKSKEALLSRPAFIWTKLIRLSYIISFNITFPKGLTRQDIPVHWKLITQTDKISILSERLSFYRQHLNATTSVNNENVFDLAIVMDITKSFLKKSNLYDIYSDEFLRQQINLLYGMVDSIDSRLKEKAIRMLKERLGPEQLEYIDSNKPIRWQARIYMNSIRGKRIAKMKYKVWLLLRKIYRSIKF